MSTSLRAESLPAMVRSHFPEISFERVVLPRQGLDHAVAILYGTPEGPVVARAPYTREYRVQAPTEAAVLDEVAALSRVALPRPVRASPDGALTLHTLVPGTPLDAEALHGLGDRRAAAHRQLGELLTVLHSRDVSREPFRSVEPWRTGAGWNPAQRALPAKIDLLRQRAQRYLPDVLDATALSDVARFFADMDVLLDPSRPARLIHGDLYDDHLLWDEERERLGVIDFSDMNLGDPAVDFAHLADPRGVLAHYDAGADDSLLHRAGIYRRWDSVYLLVDHLRTGRTPGDLAWAGFASARAELDR